MTLAIADWVIPLFFLSALVIMAKFRREIQAEDKESFVYITAGLMLLALASVSRVYYMDGSFAHIPFLSDALFYRITSWIVIITGTTFIVSGLATWLPIARRLRQDAGQRIRRLEFLKKAERLAAIQTSPERSFQALLDCMAEHYDLQQAIAYRYSQSHEVLVLTGCTKPELKESLHTQVSLKATEWDLLCERGPSLIARLFTGIAPQETPSVVLPLVLDEGPGGCFLLWGDESLSRNQEATVNLKIAVDILARKITGEKLRLAAAHYARLAHFHGELDRVRNSTETPSEKIAATLRATKNAMHAQLVSLWMVTPGAEFFARFTIGEAGSLLHEKGLPLGDSYAGIRERMKDPEGILLHREQPQSEELLNAAVGRDFDHALIVPMVSGSEEELTLVVGTRGAASLTRADARLLWGQTPSLVQIVKQAIEPTPEEPVDRRLAAIDRIFSVFKRSGDIDALFQSATEFLTKSMQFDMARGVTVETSGLFASSRGLSVRVPTALMTPAQGMMVRALMPSLERVLLSGQIVYAQVGRSDRSLTLSESNQLFDENVRAIALVPIRVRNGVVGAICLGSLNSRESQNPDRTALLPARLLAQGLGLALELVERPDLSSNELYRLEYMPQSLKSDLDLRSRVKSSLSGIVGSVELMTAQNDNVDPQMERYLRIIDRSAKRISEYLDPEEETLAAK